MAEDCKQFINRFWPCSAGLNANIDTERTICIIMLITDVFVYLQVVLSAVQRSQLASSQRRGCLHLRSGCLLKSSAQYQRHEMSRAHEIAHDLTEKGRRDLLGNIVKTVSETVLAETDAVFRTAYYLAKMN